LTLGAFVVTAVALALRPQLLGMTLMALTLLMVVERRAHPQVLWAVPLIVLVWANIHGSFFLGILVLGLAWLEDLHDHAPQAHRALAAAAVAALLANLNPFGFAIWRYAAGLSTNALVTSRITEWQPTTLRTIPGLLFFASVALVVVLLARRGRATSWPALAALAVFAAIGVYAIRGVAWWPLGAAVAVAGVLASGAPVRVRSERSSPVNVAVTGLIVAACVILLPIWRPFDARVGAPVGLVGDAPPGVTAALKELAKPGDRILNPQPWGSWFEFAVPGSTVALDSRIEVFPESVWDAVDRIRAGGEGWQAQLRLWNVRIVVTEHADADLTGRLVASGWTLAFSDATGSVLLSPAV
jgi:hypothetical protein